MITIANIDSSLKRIVPTEFQDKMYVSCTMARVIQIIQQFQHYLLPRYKGKDIQIYEQE